MSENDDKLTDDELARAWRSASAETTPGKLDRAVLREAARARSAGSGWFSPARMRSFAFAATMLLGVSLLWRMQDETSVLPTTVPDPATTTQYGTPGLLPRADSELVDVASPGAVRRERAEQIEATAVAEAESGGQDAPAASPAATAPLPREDSADFASETPRSAKVSIDQARELTQMTGTDAAQASAANATAPPRASDELRSASRVQSPAADEEVDRGFAATAKIAAPEPVAAGDLEEIAVTAAPMRSRQAVGAAETSCTEKEREEAEAWWDCIAKLERAGLDELAAEERDALEEAFPEFQVPE